MGHETKRIKIAGFRVIYGPSTIGRIYEQSAEKSTSRGMAIDLRYSQPAAAGIPVPSSQWLDFAREEADAVFFGFPSDFKALGELFGNLIKELDKPVIPVTPELAAMATLPADIIERALNFHVYGGKENIEQFLNWLGELAGNVPAGTSHAPKDLPRAGIYHPGTDRYFTDLEDYLTWYKKREPLVGLLFPRTFWVEENLAAFNAIVHEIESRGAGVIPVFSDGWFGQVKNDDVIRQFFIHDHRVRIEALVSYSAFFLKSRQKQAAIEREATTDVLKQLNVPILKMIHAARQTEEQWRAEPQGLNLPQVIISITLPEFDGLIEPILVGGSDGTGDYAPAKPLAGQVPYLVDRLMQWIALRHKTNAERKVAFVLLNSPCKSVEATVGTAFGLDSLESMARIMQKMQAAGYRLDWVPENGRELIDEIMGRKALPDFRWTTIDEIVSKGGAADFVPLETYRQWFATLPPDAREKVSAAWGDPDATRRLSGVQKLSFGLHEGKIVISGIKNGNVFIGVQPKRGCAGSRCDGEVCKILHDPEVPPPHQWLAWHQWLENDFGADVVVHVGTHGVLELLPGKTTALTESCFPRISLGKAPHLYIYNLTNPMEAVVAKRRSNAVITDHMPPVLATMRLSDDLADLEELLEDYQKAAQLKEKARTAALLTQIEEKARAAKLLPEDKAADPDVLHEKLTLLRESQFRDGLHIFGQAPEGEGLAEMLNTVLKLDQPDCPALRRALAEQFGWNFDAMQEAPEQTAVAGATNGKRLDDLDRLGRDMILDILDMPPDAADEAMERAQKHLTDFTQRCHLSVLNNSDSLQTVLAKALRIIPLVCRTTDEMKNLLCGFNGEFIGPGASGALARGKVEVLPTGRNLYSIDPWRIPTAAAWAVGKRLADDLFARYIEDEGAYPETVGLTLRAMDPYRSDGEMLGQILYTLGVEPVWSAGRVIRLTPIALETLGRPRIDCTVNLSSMLRDGMPRAFELIDQAVQMTAELDEPVEQNYVRKHVLEREAELAGEHDAQDARRLATLRIFSAAPGTYGTGVETAIAASAWQDEKDLAGVYFQNASYAYGQDLYARKAVDELIHNCSRVTITFEKFDSDEIDLLDCCHINGWHGGFTNAAEVASGKKVKTLYGDTSDPNRPAIRTLNEELSRIAHTRLLNPAWIEGKKRHGYKGAGDISSRANHMYGWQATTKQVDNWVFDGIAEKFLIDEENRQFFEENNPWALEEIGRRLLEAESRGLWKADPEIMEQLKEIYLEIEGWLEDRMGDVTGDFQGGAVDIITSADIPGWKEKMEEVYAKL
ncbi:cobaltochelatase subunit CobN [Desulfosarcina ovata subsp. sediminis]|uniref:Cobaltochelatase subunit CobN n=1 Tax=Desulfosarcina ovata subsp. sediminis TaxID=885957 RepID=A0A5K7ZN91_9BACT|nr:cobaltochelatase subunit CobN [Desulfosarcina ovata]BBO81945.1 cobaltochelatase subunit CobN [Desulfosarcina ovata subsp. sediminis]